jgi:saccharopine dehydrogenase (NAD+, L-lysine-forming)
MKTILILGGYGQTGRLLAHYLLDETDCRLILAGRRPERGAALAAALNERAGRERVTTALADAADLDGLARALAGVDLVLVAASTAAHCETVARAALIANCDYLDIQYATAKVATLQRLAPEIAAAGRCFITDGGFHPGLPAALVRSAAARFDRLERANVGSVIAVDWAALDLGPETKIEFVTEFMDFDSRVFRDRRWQKLGLASMASPLTMAFGPPFGRRACIAMTLGEMDALPDLIPSLRETGFYVGGFNWFSDWFVSPLVMVGLKLAPRRLLSPLARLQFWSMAHFAQPPYGTVLQLEATGTRDGAPHALTLRLAHDDAYALTAIPVVACLRQWLAGPRRPGLWYQGQYVEPEALLVDMARMGVVITTEESVHPTRFRPHLAA